MLKPWYTLESLLNHAFYHTDFFAPLRRRFHPKPMWPLGLAANKMDHEREELA